MDLAQVEKSSQLWNRHKLAALCLYQQPFGFTREDVRMVTVMAEDCERVGIYPDSTAFWRSLADRIAALLPPEAP